LTGECSEPIANASNGFPNAQYRVLSFLEAQPEEWTPTVLAKELRMPKGTVRWALKRLKEQGKVVYRRVGIVHLYGASKRFSDDFNRMFKQYRTDKLYQIHGLTLKRMGDFANALPLGGMDESSVSGDGVRGGVLRWGFDWFGGKVSFQLSAGTLVVYGSFTECPLDYDRWVLFLSCLDGHLSAKGLPRILDEMGLWLVVQYGFNRDWKRFRNDKPTECVSVQGFTQWFARIYNKKPLGVLREEIHSSEERSLEQFCQLVDGSLTSVQVMNFLDVLARNMNSLQASNFELSKRVATAEGSNLRLASVIESLLRRIEKTGKH